MDKNINHKDYRHVQNVFKHFVCSNLRGYNALYLKTGTLLLADVVYHSRKLCYNAHRLELLHCISVASYLFQCILKSMGVKLELIINKEMFNVIQLG